MHAIAPKIPPAAVLLPDGYLTQREAAALLRLSVKTLQVMRRRGQLPFYRFGHRSIRYRRQDLETLIRRERRSA